MPTMKVVTAAVLCCLLAVTARAQLYGTIRNSVVRFDTSTGAMTTVATFAQQNEEQFPFSAAMDTVSHRYFVFFRTYFVSVQVDTGAVSIVPLPSQRSFERGQPVVFDPVSARILTVMFFPEVDLSDRLRLVSIDPVTGATTQILLLSFLSLGALAIDPATRRVFYAPSGTELQIINLATLDVTTIPVQAHSPKRLVYDSVTGKLMSSYEEGRIVTIDPVAGAVEPVSSQPPFVHVLPSFSPDLEISSPSRLLAFRAIDDSRRQILLAIVNIDTGALLPLPPQALQLAMYEFGGREALVADLSLTKTTDTPAAMAGGHITYHLTVRNDGPDAATTVTVTDPLPAGTTFVSATSSQGSASLSGGTVTASLGTISAGASATIDLIVSPLTTGTVVNTATVDATESDASPLNNAASVTSAAVPSAPIPALDPFALLCLAGALAAVAFAALRQM